MRYRSSLGSATILFLASLSPALAAAHTGSHSKAVSHSVVRTFRLQVSGPVNAGATFWVAYGPLAGKWGLVHLRPIGNGVYQSTAHLPGQGRTTFSYIQGQGTVDTRLGLAPGDPTITIRRFDRVLPTAPQLALVRWNAPIG